LTQLWHTQFGHLFDDDLLVFVSVAVGELGTPGPGHFHATAAQLNVRSNPLLESHLGDVAGRKPERVGLVCSSESVAQWHYNQRFRLIKDECHERDHSSVRDCSLRLGFSLYRDPRTLHQ